jgi:hypothetical protein
MERKIKDVARFGTTVSISCMGTALVRNVQIQVSIDWSCYLLFKSLNLKWVILDHLHVLAICFPPFVLITNNHGAWFRRCREGAKTGAKVVRSSY